METKNKLPYKPTFLMFLIVMTVITLLLSFLLNLLI